MSSVVHTCIQVFFALLCIMFMLLYSNTHVENAQIVTEYIDIHVYADSAYVYVRTYQYIYFTICVFIKKLIQYLSY